MLQNVWLRKFSKLTCYSTLFLIFAGGMVKSTDSGLAVPDWPLSYGTLFPPMVGGVFYEHGHRMIATCVGFFMLILTIWLALKENRQWVKVMGYCALGAVILQGVLGGITVLYFLPTPISVMHGVLAQTFFLMTIFLAYSQSTERQIRSEQTCSTDSIMQKVSVTFVVLIYIQLILGAIMRHTGSGLAIYDFPTIAGDWWPAFNDSLLYRINDWRFEQGLDPISMTNIVYHLLHRIGALAIIIAICFLNYAGLKCQLPNRKSIIRTVLLIDLMIVIQITLGIATLLTFKSPVITSLHVVIGAATLGVAFLLYLRVVPVAMKDFAH